MRSINLAPSEEPLRVLCLGAHSDDIEIGCGGTILSWIAEKRRLDVCWCVLSAVGSRAEEATSSATEFLTGAENNTIWLGDFKDGYFQYQGAALKDRFESLKREINPDIIFTHKRNDAHQDHREICKLTWNSFRDHLILEYEIPKWDGDIGQPNCFQPLKRTVLETKVALLLKHFGSQRSKDWFDAETFRGLARLRGTECRAADGMAEAFNARKILLA